MILHTLNASPSSAAYADCLRLLQVGDTLLLMGDGVYGALPGSQGYEALKRQAQRGVEVYLLERDALAAGVAVGLSLFPALDMAGFVELTERHAQQQAWY